jgi:GntR family transcriptional repressor for pyruvate dehydrogenase complex
MDHSVPADAINVQLAEMIRVAGPGTRLPSERAMAEELGVSRVALRDRLQGFEFLGMIERRQGSGTVARMLDPKGMAEMLDLMLASAHVSHADLHVVRIALERESARQAAVAEELDLEEMYRCLYIFEHGSRPEEMAAADKAFHSHLMKLSGSPGLSFFADALQMSLFKSLQYRNQRWSKRVGAKNLLVDLHMSIVKAIESRDPEAAALAVDAHFVTFDRLVASDEKKKPSKRAAKSK